jgi:O-antigen/teichoic acid export membrane protein
MAIRLISWSGLVFSRLRQAWDVGVTQKGTIRDLFSTAGIGFAVTLLGSVGGIVAARLLGPEGRGELAAAVVWASILTALASLGLPQALTYHVARTPEAVGQIFSTTLALTVVQSGVVLIVGYLVSAALLAHAQLKILATVRIYLLSIPFSLLTGYLSTMAQGLKRFGLFNLLRLASTVGYVSALVLAAIIGFHQAQPLIWLLLGVQVLMTVIALLLFCLQVRPKGGLSYDRAHELLSYGLKSYWGNLSWMANVRLDQFLMSSLIGMRELGQYAVAVSYGTAIFPLSASFAIVLFPRIAGDTSGQALQKIKKALRYNLIISGSAALFFGLLSPWLLPGLFGRDYRTAVRPAILLLSATVLLGCNYVLSDGMRGLGAPLVASFAEMLAVGITLIALLVLLPSMGIIGAALASIMAYGAVFLVLIIKIRRMSCSENARVRP